MFLVRYKITKKIRMKHIKFRFSSKNRGGFVESELADVGFLLTFAAEKEI